MPCEPDHRTHLTRTEELVMTGALCTAAVLVSWTIYKGART